MAENVNKKIRRILNYSLCSLLLSLCALVIVSFVDVAPSKQASLERLFYSCLIVFIASLSASVYSIWKRCYWPEIVYVMNKRFVILLCGGLLCCGMFLMPHLDFGRAVHKEPQSVHDDVEVAIKSLSLASKRYDALNVVDVFGDIYYRANKRLAENGLYGIGLHLENTNTDVDTSSVTVDVPELTIFQAFEFVARRFGWTVEYNGGGVFVRGERAER